jgi:hypothetical protein
VLVERLMHIDPIPFDSELIAPAQAITKPADVACRRARPRCRRGRTRGHPDRHDVRRASAVLATTRLKIPGKSTLKLP